MPKRINLRQGLGSLLFWSIISAAFIGPGTVTTAAKAGSAFGLELLWALTFSIIATILLQEAAARITIASGRSLGELIAEKYGASRVRWVKITLFLAVAFGCAAYQAGNLLGAVSGLLLILPQGKVIMLMTIGLLASSLLMAGKIPVDCQFVGNCSSGDGRDVSDRSDQFGCGPARDSGCDVHPQLESRCQFIDYWVDRTTIVPYNLFLASGISQGQNIREMRLGLILAIIIGGLISMGILIAGTQVEGTFSFERLAEALSASLGEWASYFFAFGLFAAGLTSSITAPLAAAVTARSLFGQEGKNWMPRSRNFRLVWGIIILLGLLFSLTNIQPIPAIIAAQAINGVLLPVVAIFLILTVNDKKLLPEAFVNKGWVNILMLLVLLVCCFLGINNVLKALQRMGLWSGLSPNCRLYSGDRFNGIRCFAGGLADCSPAQGINNSILKSGQKRTIPDTCWQLTKKGDNFMERKRKR
jgi:manganese transport protein